MYQLLSKDGRRPGPLETHPTWHEKGQTQHKSTNTKNTRPHRDIAQSVGCIFLEKIRQATTQPDKSL